MLFMKLCFPVDLKTIACIYVLYINDIMSIGTSLLPLLEKIYVISSHTHLCGFLCAQQLCTCDVVWWRVKVRKICLFLLAFPLYLHILFA